MSENIPTITLQVSASNTVQAPIDDTLSIAGQAADAKAVGDAIEDAKTELQEDIETASETLQGNIDTLSGTVGNLPGTLFPIGIVCVTTSEDPPSFVGTWQEVMIPATWGDLEDGARSYAARGESDTPGTLHFWIRTA